MLLAVVLAYGCARQEATHGTAEKGATGKASVPADAGSIGSQVAEFELADLSGKKVRLSDFKGKVVVLDFWATWCGPCRVEIPDFVKLQSKYKDKGLEIVGLSLDADGAAAVGPFLKEHQVNYTMLLANDDTAKSFGGNSRNPDHVRHRPAGKDRPEVHRGDAREDLRGGDPAASRELGSPRVRDAGQSGLAPGGLPGGRHLVHLPGACCRSCPRTSPSSRGSRSTRLTAGSVGPRVRRLTIIHSLAFILGFGWSSSPSGPRPTVAGQFLRLHQDSLRRVGGVMIILFGIFLTGIIPIPALSRERKKQCTTKPLGILGSVLVGVTFAAGWTPCIGPILASILIYASTAKTVGTGILLLSVYSLGLGVPFFIASLTLNSFLSASKGIRKHLRTIEVASGVILILFGILLVTDLFPRFVSFLSRFLPVVG